MPGTVTYQNTNILLVEDPDGGTWEGIGSASSGGYDDSLPIQGTFHRGERIDNEDDGFSWYPGSTRDLSASGTHFGIWINVFQPAQITTNTVRARLGGSTTDPENSPWSEWNMFTGPSGSNPYPPTGGWQRVWIDVASTPDTTSGTLTLSSVAQFGFVADMLNVGGTSDNVHIDRLDFGTGGLLVDSGTVPSPATFQDFVAADEGNSSNRYGIVQTLNGTIFMNGPLTIGDATATIFNDSGIVLAYADQILCASDWLGITVDLQNASTDVDWDNITLYSGGTTNEGDLIVTGTSGAFDVTNSSFNSLRVMTLTSACTISGSTIANTGLITLGEADIAGCSILTSSVAADEGAVFDDRTTTAATDLTEYTGCTFSQGTNAHHAIRFGTNVDDDLTLTNVELNGFDGTDSTNGSTFRFDATSGSIDLNLTGCTVDGVAATTSNVGIDSAGITVNLVIDPVTLSITALDADTESPVEDASVYMKLTSGDGGAVVLNALTNASGVATASYSGSLPVTLDNTVSAVRSGSGPKPYVDFPLSGTIDTSGYSQTVLLSED